MGRKVKWTNEEIEILRKYWGRMDVSEIARILGRTKYSVYKKAQRLGVTRNRKYSTEEMDTTEEKSGDSREKPEDPAQELLGRLRRSKYPCSEEELLAELGLDEEEFRDLINLLQTQGYDIKAIYKGGKIYWVLVRFDDKKVSYRLHGKVELPLLLTADWHIGSFGFSREVFELMLDDIREYGVREVLHAGDLIQGRGVHRLEANDLKVWRIDEQEALAAKYISKVPVKVHAVLGNHEAKIKGSVDVGHDPLLAIAHRVGNLNYYGSVANLEFDEGKRLLMYHGSGGVSYAWSYKPQRFFDALNDKPDLLVVGHYHIMFVGTHSSGARLILPGTLQRENSYLMSKGLFPILGYIILLDWKSDGRVEWLERTPTYH